jgi:hypothetical protein
VPADLDLHCSCSSVHLEQMVNPTVWMYRLITVNNGHIFQCITLSRLCVRM